MTPKKSRNIINQLIDLAIDEDPNSMADVLTKLLDKQNKQIVDKAKDLLEEMLFQGIIECDSIYKARRFMHSHLRNKEEVKY